MSFKIAFEKFEFVKMCALRSKEKMSMRVEEKKEKEKFSFISDHMKKAKKKEKGRRREKKRKETVEKKIFLSFPALPFPFY